MDWRRIRYTLALWCLILTIALVMYKFFDRSNNVWNTSITTGAIITQTTTTVTWVRSDPIIIPTQVSSTRSDLFTSMPVSTDNYILVQQANNPYLLIDNRNLIALATTVYSGARTWVIKISDTPLVVYYRYQLPDTSYTYLYDSSSNSSRELDQLQMIGKIWQVFLFSIQESDWYRGISAMIAGQLQTLYMGTYTSAQYLWDIIKLNNNQQIYLPLRSTWS